MTPLEIAVVATGGTIACEKDDAGALVPRRLATQLIQQARIDVPFRPVDIRSLDSSAMTLADIDDLVATVHEQLADPKIAGVVVTHGTDSMVDTALALDLFHTDSRPVVLTGAQYAADAPSPDGPENLRTAFDYIAGGGDSEQGVVIAFGGEILPARGLVKVDTHALDAFRPTYPDVASALERPTPLSPVALAALNIPIVAGWAGAGPDILDAVIQMHPDGVVVEGMGSGNVSEQMGHAIKRARAVGIPVVLTTVVPHGKVEFAYGGAGGGATLGETGVIPGGWLRASQARIALAVALATGTDPASLICG